MTFQYRDAAILVLYKNNSLMHVKDIFAEMISNGYIKHTNLEKYESLRGILDKSILNIENKIFMKDSPGVYGLNLEEANRYLDKMKRKGKILVFSKKSFEGISNFHGIRKADKKIILDLLDTQNPIYKPRMQAELDNSVKQIVSYIILKYKGRVLRFRRQEEDITQVRDYVDGYYSIGFGGHVQEKDRTMFSSQLLNTGYFESVRRELKEEINLDLDIGNLELDIIGILNDNSTARGRNHIAILHTIELKSDNVKAGESSIQDLKFVSFDEISTEFQFYEYWSRLFLQHYFKEKLNFACHIQPNSKFSFEGNSEIISIVGGIGTGKSHVCNMFEEEYQYQKISCSNILFDLLKINKQGKSREELQNIGLDFVSKEGGHIFFAKAIKKIIGDNKKIILDGLRFPETQKELEKLVKRKITTIYIETTPEQQHENFVSRGETNIDLNEFITLLDHKVETKISSFLPISQILIFNQSSKKSLKENLLRFVESELGPPEKFNISSWDINALKRHKQITSGMDISFSKLITPSIVNLLRKKDNFQKFNILEVGCGTGELSDIFSKEVHHVTGIDPSCKSIDIAKRAYGGNKKINYVCSNIIDFLTDENMIFDYVASHMVFHTVPPNQIEPSIKLIRNSLRKSGHLVFTIPHPFFFSIKKPNTFGSPEEFKYFENKSFRYNFKTSYFTNPLPSKTPFFHRPLNFYTEILVKAGFVITKLSELYPDKEIMKLYPKNKKFEYPNFLLVECQVL